MNKDKILFILSLVLISPLIMIYILLIIFLTFNLQTYEMGFFGNILFYMIFCYPKNKLFLIYPAFSSIILIMNFIKIKIIGVRITIIFFILLYFLLILHSILNSSITINP